MPDFEKVHGYQLTTGWKAVSITTLFAKNLECWNAYPTGGGTIEEGSFSAWPDDKLEYFIEDKDNERESQARERVTHLQGKSKDFDNAVANAEINERERQSSRQDQFTSAKIATTSSEVDTDSQKERNTGSENLSKIVDIDKDDGWYKDRLVFEKNGRKRKNTFESETLTTSKELQRLSQGERWRTSPNGLQTVLMKSADPTRYWGRSGGATAQFELKEQAVSKSSVYINAAPEGARVYDKTHSCFFCNKEYQKIARHLQQVHGEEEEVKEALSYPVNDEKRKKLFEKLCRMGNFNHNMRVLEIKEGELKVVRRPASEASKDPSNYLPCKYCHGFFVSDELWRHAPKCPFKDGEEKQETSSRRMKHEGRFLLSAGKFPSGCSKMLAEKVLSIMSYDAVSVAVQSDNTILTLGSNMVDRRGAEKATEVSQKMRLLGRLLIETRKLTGHKDASLEDLLKPRLFDVLVQSARNIGGYEENDGTSSKKSFKAPATSVHCGYELKRAAVVIRCQALREQNAEKKSTIDDLLMLYESEWHDRISKPALNNLAIKKHNVPQLLPITEDLLEVRKYVIAQITQLTEKVNTSPTVERWRKLAVVCLTRLIMFNKRRGGEAAEMKLSTFQSRPNWNKVHNKEILESLSSSELELCKRFDMVEIVGKRKKKVPVIITEVMKNGIMALNKARDECGVSKDNEFVFAVNNGKSNKSLRGHDVITRVCGQLKLQEPSLITSSNLRKYVATISQLVDMNETEMGWLARHLGHDIHVHKDYYRLQDTTLELAVVGNLLMAVDEGRAHQFKGKNPRDIQLSDFDEIHNAKQNPLVLENDGSCSLSNSAAPAKGTQPCAPSSSRKCKQKTEKRTWTTEEKNAVFRVFSKHIRDKALPGRGECEEFLESNEEVVQNRKWTHVKDYVRGCIQRRAKKLS